MFLKKMLWCLNGAYIIKNLNYLAYMVGFRMLSTNENMYNLTNKWDSDINNKTWKYIQSSNVFSINTEKVYFDIIVKPFFLIKIWNMQCLISSMSYANDSGNVNQTKHIHENIYIYITRLNRGHTH